MCEAEGLEGKRGNRRDAPHPRRTVKRSWRNKGLKPEERVDVDLRVCCPYFAVSVMKFGETDLGCVLVGSSGTSKLWSPPGLNQNEH